MRNLSTTLTFLMIINTFSANATLPAKSTEWREIMSTDVVFGEVIEADNGVVVNLNETGAAEEVFTDERSEATDWARVIFNVETDRVYKAQLRIIAIKKGNMEPGSIIEVTYRQAEQRLPGWCGNIGQYKTMKKGNFVAVYLENNDGILDLIEPNGFDRY